MDLGLNEVQQMLKASAQEFLSQECPLTFVRTMEEDPRGYTDGLWRQIVNLGWTGLAFPERYGGTEGSFCDLPVLLEEMGRALCPGPFFSAVVLGGLAVLDAGTDAQKQDILPRICAGDLTMTLALTEPSVSYEPSGVETAAERQGDSYLISGTKLFVPDAQAADILLVVARTSSESDPAQGLTVFLLPADSPGISTPPLNPIPPDRQCRVDLEQVSVPASSTLGPVGEGWPVVARALQRATAGRCVEMLGGAGAVLDMTVEYVKQRTQFGRPIGSFQIIQHYCADMAIDIDGSRFTTYQAAWRLNEGLPSTKEVAIAKAWTGEAYDRVITLAHQIHGAIGCTIDHDLQFYTRQGKAAQVTFGDCDFHREIVAQEMGL